MISADMSAIIEQLRQMEAANARQPGEVDRGEVAAALGIDIRRASRMLDRGVKEGRYTRRKVSEDQEKWVYKLKED